MTKDFLATIKHRVVIFDGGMGSMLIAAGLSRSEIPEAWLMSKPEKIADVHEAYIRAGAEVVTTATFGASRIKLQSSEAGRKLDPARVNEKGVEAARGAIERSGKHDRFVAGDIGPTGLFFPPVGTLKSEDARS
ncbi:MAG: homocysteine S-methyltransferase family protein, partial [Candidatus Krumholzibacteria bacterium]|nr:homocysteine S-methyltransferase family protein [Candidatus Krumholzibacteria bacterium]